MKNIWFRLIVLIFICLVFTGCHNTKNSKEGCEENPKNLQGSDSIGIISHDFQGDEEKIDLMADIVAHYHPVNNNIINEKASLYNSFALRLFQNSIVDDGDTLISPLGVVCSMGVVTSGAKGATLKQMEKVFGVSHDEMNEYVNSYVNKAKQSSFGRLNSNFSVWINKESDIKVNDSILQLNADIYKHRMYSVPFNKNTLDNINEWIGNGNSFSPNFLDSISPKDSIYLVGNVRFEGKWEDSYMKKQIKKLKKFKTYAGNEKTVKMLHSHEKVYLNGKNYSGFMKFYNNKDYAFVALLPNKELDIKEFIRSLDKDGLNSILAERMDIEVIAEIPAFSNEVNVDIEPILKRMGMGKVFDDELADLSGIGTSKTGKSFFVSKVFNKVSFMLNENGSVDEKVKLKEDNEGESLIDDLKKEVILDRPFVYMVIDTKHNIPLLMGTLMDVK